MDIIDRYAIMMKKNPYGIQPLGNLYNNDKDHINRRQIGLGLLHCLDDDIFLEILSYLNEKDLTSLTLCSSALYIYSHYDDLWKELCISSFGGNIDIKNSWRESYIVKYQHLKGDIKYQYKHQPKYINGFYSDVLYSSWMFSRLKIKQSWLTKESIDKISFDKMSLERFHNDYDMKQIPVLIKDGAKHWPAIEKWKFDNLCKEYGDIVFNVRGIPMQLKQFINYMRNIAKNEAMPLYIFDHAFGEKAPSLLDDMIIPKYFSKDNQSDLLSLLGDKRPQYRWFLVGSARSGSTFHKDPNATSAWNVCVTGRKKWIMYPPDIIPPGVLTNDSDVVVPLSVMEWFEHFYDKINDYHSEEYPLEFIAEAGDIVFIPAGWWHIVLNLEESVAVTQNFVSAGNFEKFLDFVDKKPSQVSGLCRDIVAEFIPKLVEKDRVISSLDDDNSKTVEQSEFIKRVKLLVNEFQDKIDKKYPDLIRSYQTKKQKVGWWNQINNNTNNDTTSNTLNGASFSFNFSI